MKETVMELRGVTKKFPGVTALDNVNFAVGTGEMLGLVGENGAGKSTMMQIISGVYPHGTYEGTILLNGSPVHFRSPRDSEDAGIAMIYQELSMHLDMSILENIFLGRWLKTSTGAVDWKGMKEQTAELLKMVGLDNDPSEKLRKLSKTSQQMVSIARALQRNPRILIMDEPTACLTEREVETLFSVAHSLREKGITIILITHKLEEVFSNCERIVVLRNGRTTGEHIASKVTVDEIVTEMVGRSISAMYPKETVPIGPEILSVENLTVRHPFRSHLNILEEISFTLRKGEILGIEGLVGSGRSELVNAVFGKEGMTKGTIRIKGEKVIIKSPADAIKNGLGLVTEDRRDDGFVGIRSVRENITLANMKSICRRGRIRHRQEKKLVQDFIDKIRIKTSSQQSQIMNLSGGNQQKVVLAKWLNTSPLILFMDEPTRGIDVGAKSEIYRIMVDLAREGLGIVMISSERSELLAMCDRILVLGRGSVQGELAREDFNEDQIVSMAMGHASIN